jgi:hypothetical protein
MNNQESIDREFKGGTWDLRKEERRLAQQVITFPERRKDERRLTRMHDHYAAQMEELNWISKTGLNE